MFRFTRHRNRRRSRQPWRWVDEIKSMAGCKWTRTADDRKKWRQMGKAFANMHTDIKLCLKVKKNHLINAFLWKRQGKPAYGSPDGM